MGRYTGERYRANEAAIHRRNALFNAELLLQDIEQEIGQCEAIRLRIWRMEKMRGRKMATEMAVLNDTACALHRERNAVLVALDDVHAIDEVFRVFSPRHRLPTPLSFDE